MASLKCLLNKFNNNKIMRKHLEMLLLIRKFLMDHLIKEILLINKKIIITITSKCNNNNNFNNNKNKILFNHHKMIKNKKLYNLCMLREIKVKLMYQCKI
jgi:hypothetical protein